jgi:protein-tyrosine phosphatase
LHYVGRSAPKDHQEYLIAERDGHLILNMVDAPDPSYIPKEIIDKALKTINEKISNQKVLVHCNQGMSRSAVIGMLFLHLKGLLPDDFYEAEKKFLEIYAFYAPNNGMRMYAFNNWDNYGFY